MQMEFRANSTQGWGPGQPVLSPTAFQPGLWV